MVSGQWGGPGLALWLWALRTGFQTNPIPVRYSETTAREVKTARQKAHYGHPGAVTAPGTAQAQGRPHHKLQWQHHWPTHASAAEELKSFLAHVEVKGPAAGVLPPHRQIPEDAAAPASPQTQRDVVQSCLWGC